MNSLLISIAKIPISILGLVLISEAEGFLVLPLVLKIFLWQTFYLYITFLLSRQIFVGQFTGYSKVDYTNTGVMQAYTAFLILLLAPFSIVIYLSFTSLTFPVLIEVCITVGAVVLAFVVNYGEFKFLKASGIQMKKTLVTPSTWSRYIAWYHYLALLLFVFFNMAVFLA